MPSPDWSCRGEGLVTLALLCPTAELPRRPPADSSASRSRKSDHSSARDSLLDPVGLLTKSDVRPGVLGVRRNGDSGTRSCAFDAPGLARPACSRCSVVELA